MTSNAHKAAARRYQAQHPGTPLPVALRATARPVSLDPLRGTSDAGSSVSRDVLQAFLGTDLSADELQVLEDLVRQGRQARPLTTLSELLAQANADGWRIIYCTSSSITPAPNVEIVLPQDFSRFARNFATMREAELRQLDVHRADQLPPDSAARKILLLVDPDDLDTIHAKVLCLLIGQTPGISVHIAHMPTAGETTSTTGPTGPTVGSALDQPPSSNSSYGPHSLMMGDPTIDKALRYRLAFAVFAQAGCQIAATDDGIALTVTAPAGMSREKFDELTQRAWG